MYVLVRRLTIACDNDVSRCQLKALAMASRKLGKRTTEAPRGANRREGSSRKSNCEINPAAVDPISRLICNE